MADILVKGTRIAEEVTPHTTPPRGMVSVSRLIDPALPGRTGGLSVSPGTVIPGADRAGFMAVAGFWKDGALRAFVGTGATVEAAEMAALKQAFAAEMAGD